MRIKLKSAILLAIFTFAMSAVTAFACAPGFLIDVYESKDILSDHYPLGEGVDAKTPDDYPVLNQKYEVITPGWGVEFLLPVYLSAEGKELPKPIKTMQFEYYKHRGGYSSRPLHLIGINEEKDGEVGINMPVDNWLKIRKVYFSDINNTEDEKVLRNNLNMCPDQSLERAIDDYEYRKTKFSEKEISNWVKSQDGVFQKCKGGIAISNDKITKMPNLWESIIIYLKNINKKAVPIDQIANEKLLKYDLEYHQAASAYYSDNLTLASKLFKEIVNDKSNPYRQLAALSLGWTYIAIDGNNHEIDLKEEKTTADSKYIENLKQTQKYYENLISSTDYESVKTDAQRYLDFILFRTDPAKRLIEAEKVLLNPSDEKEFVRHLEDFNRLWYKYFQRVLIYQKEEPQHKDYAKKITDSQSPFLRFLLEWEKPTPEAVQYSLDNFKNNNNSLWLILALRQSSEGQKDFEFIKEEISKIKPESPFYLTSQYYLLEQLSKDQKNKDEAKILAEKLIKETYNNRQLVAFNLFSDIRESLAIDPNESAKYSIRYSVASYSNGFEGLFSIPYYSYDYVKSTDSINKQHISNKMKLYLSSLNSADLSKFIIENTGSMQDSLKRYLKLTAFNRAFVLGDLKSTDLLAKDIARTDSSLVISFNQYLSANTDMAKNFMAAKILIDYPSVFPQIGNNLDDFATGDLISLKAIDSFRRNWASGTCMNDRYKPDNYTETEIDIKVISKNSVNYLMNTVVDYMSKNPTYSDPELLHKVVEVGHYAACTDKETTEIARQAFQLLHTRYPNNYWSKQTPYWY